LINFGGALTNQFFTNPMTRLKILLGNRFDRNKPHRWSGHGFANSFSIFSIIFVGFNVRLHKLGCHQFDGMPKFLQFPCPIMRPTAGFHPNQTGVDCAKKA